MAKSTSTFKAKIPAALHTAPESVDARVALSPGRGLGVGRRT
ncbi:predicted protein [Plenodomus lingam JN3]|uniref:Predicted protein n=1 Tax=Leptosphaeria maculans (strain JN3 / isolate v23.1.3 / race Av1-4-5-6-7-8) TaxID=985895 RepID=E4ZXN6_LEPMJ|nr:predicted protein [Plenodomus lingam JN3]CBX96131.1 predicted protein [Plenodomus lingam JN3]